MVILPNTHPSGFVVILLCEDMWVGFLRTYYGPILRKRKKDTGVGMLKMNGTIVCEKRKGGELDPRHINRTEQSE